MFATSLVDAENSLAVVGALLAIVATSLAAARTRWGAHLSPAPFVVLLAVLLANLHVIPFKAPAYGFVSAHLVPMAVVLLLLDANLRAIFRVSGRALAAFFIGALGALLGCWIAFLTVPLGEWSLGMATLYSTVVTGGMVNLMQTGKATGIFERYPELLAAIISGSVLVDIGYMFLMTQMARIGLLARPFHSRCGTWQEGRADDAPEPSAEQGQRWAEPMSSAVALAVALILIAACNALAAAVGVPQLGIVFVGTVTVMLATFAHRFIARLQPMQPLGMLCLFLFLASVSAGGDAAQLGRLGLQIALFVLVVYTVHLLVLLPVAWMARIPLALVVVGSLAGIAGPATTAAIAGSQRWFTLIVPGTMLALLGLSLGTYVGLGVYKLLGG